MSRALRRGAAWLFRLAPMLGALVVLMLCAPARAGDDFLAPEAAFRFSARMLDPKTVELRYDVAEGYYLYREQFRFEARQASLGEPVFPPGKVKYDDTFQKNVESHRGSVAIRLPVDGAGPFTLTATAQGCSDRGLCYPPMTSSVRLDVGGGAGAAPETEMGRIEAALGSGELLAIVPLFALLGLGLAFTPCVLPMIPILSSIVIGDRQRATRSRSLALSASYSLGMAIVYTLLGVAAGLAGEGLAAALQNRWVLGAFALLMAALALSMFGAYQLQMPAWIQSRLSSASGRLASGSHAGVFVMGALSALIVGPCVAAPLAGALVYISQTRDALTGGAALFAMAAGMSVPLLAVGASAGALLPRAGSWMDGVKRFFGVLMLASAWWIVTPVLPARIQMLGWAALGIGYAWFLLAKARRRRLALAAAFVFGGLGLAQLAGVATGATDPAAPLAHWGGQAAHGASFRRVASVAELDAVLAGAPGKVVMLDFYADWCVSCKEMEQGTFSDARVQRRLADMLLLQADVTANSAADEALLKRFGLFGPPGIVFFDGNGREMAGRRVIGFQDAEKFLALLPAAPQR